MTISVKNPTGHSGLQFIGILLEYENADNKWGEYGVIAKYDIEKDSFSFDEVFA